MDDTMLMALVVCDAGVSEQIIEMFLAEGASYSVLHGAYGNGESGRRENTPVWPGVNVVILSALTETQKQAVHARFEALRRQRAPRHVPLRMFTWPLQESL